ncbi:hypothetical protein [Alkalihalophilus marmarensis]|uniref:hypothetical protein n=1 Tax=Alkalihalophilus marmarensis TaxID=521377 RepID=UPI002DB60EB4|nr:hypothetical protein [Alkalihalophilus marmarensis]MEC2071374.1 hypothetical protein [Alkalihalophilus marmarensis]
MRTRLTALLFLLFLLAGCGGEYVDKERELTSLYVQYTYNNNQENYAANLEFLYPKSTAFEQLKSMLDNLNADHQRSTYHKLVNVDIIEPLPSGVMLVKAEEVSSLYQHDFTDPTGEVKSIIAFREYNGQWKILKLFAAERSLEGIKDEVEEELQRIYAEE